MKQLMIATPCETIDASILKESKLSIKQLSELMNVKAERLYSINKGKVKMSKEELNKLEYINSVLENLEKEMKEW